MVVERKTDGNKFVSKCETRIGQRSNRAEGWRAGGEDWRDNSGL